LWVAWTVVMKADPWVGLTAAWMVAKKVERLAVPKVAQMAVQWADHWAGMKVLQSVETKGEQRVDRWAERSAVLMAMKRVEKLVSR